eukprot:4135006-Amphidinium_carterae.1
MLPPYRTQARPVAPYNGVHPPTATSYCATDTHTRATTSKQAERDSLCQGTMESESVGHRQRSACTCDDPGPAGLLL